MISVNDIFLLVTQETIEAPHFGQGGPWVNRRDHLVSVGKTVDREPSCFQGWGWLRLMRMDDAWIERKDCLMD